MSNWSGAAPGGQHPVKHGLGFLFSGALAFAVDASVLTALTLLGMHPIAARLFAISVAMVAGWLAHRRFTFRLATPPTASEFLRYAAVQWTVAAINYATFVAIVLLQPSIEPFYALIASSLVAMVFAYLGMRFAAFRKLGGTQD
ncbi:MAG: GtrA family protein [Hyphomonadaceae bacterium]|nr:GtrA family protein [Hyphomonadaceae bacterium]